MTGTSRLEAAIVQTQLDTSASRSFSPGQRVIGRVLEATAPNQFLLAVGGDRLLAHSTLALSPGADIALEVMKTGATIEMRLVTADLHAAPDASGSTAPAEDRLALAALVNAARTSRGEHVAPFDRGAFLKTLDALVKAGPSNGPAGVAALAQAVAPQETTEDAPLLAARLRAAFENGGQLFEAHLRSVIEAHPGLSDQQALERLREDTRSLLGRTAEALADVAGHDLARSARTHLEAAAENVLARQVQSALHWIADGALTFKLPVRLPSGETDAEVTLRRRIKDDDADADEKSPAFDVRFRVDSNVLGTVVAHASWGGGTLNTTISVGTSDAKELLQPELTTLEHGLRESFPRVLASLVVDPVRVHASPQTDAVPELPGGSLLNVHA